MMYRKTVKIVSAFAISALFLANTHAEENYDFTNKESYYQTLCNKRSSYNANKKACQAYESYLNDVKTKSNKNVDSLKKEIESTKGDITKLIEAIKKNEEVIKTTKAQVSAAKKEIATIEKEIAKLEKEMKKRISLVQEVSAENFVIDFVMNSTSLDEFLTKLDGINAINSANNDLSIDMKSQRDKLTKKEKELKETEANLSNAKKEQDELLKTYRSKEAELFNQMEENRKKTISYTNKASQININDQLEKDLNNEPGDSVAQQVEASEPEVKEETPKQETPKKETPKKETPKKETPKKETPKKETPKKETSNNKKPASSNNSSALQIPVKHATVTAASWYYPASFGGGWHPGIDLANNYGTNVVSPGKGVVLLAASEGGGYGNYIVTAHQVGKDTYTFLYGHLNQFVKTSGTLKKGQVIGKMGSTGNSTGPHTHVEIIRHKNKTLKQVVNQFNRNYDIYFGLGYMGTGTGSNVSRLKPHEFFGIRYGQVY